MNSTTNLEDFEVYAVPAESVALSCNNCSMVWYIDDENLQALVNKAEDHTCGLS